MVRTIHTNSSCSRESLYWLPFCYKSQDSCKPMKESHWGLSVTHRGAEWLWCGLKNLFQGLGHTRCGQCWGVKSERKDGDPHINPRRWVHPIKVGLWQGAQGKLLPQRGCLFWGCSKHLAVDLLLSSGLSQGGGWDMQSLHAAAERPSLAPVKLQAGVSDHIQFRTMLQSRDSGNGPQLGQIDIAKATPRK
jgi:hypothetical protein